MKRRLAVIEIYGPVGEGYCNCRRCGGRALVYLITGIGEVGKYRYWECEDCGQFEVVSGTPMKFGESYLAGREECVKRYNEYRRYAGLDELV